MKEEFGKSEKQQKINSENEFILRKINNQSKVGENQINFIPFTHPIYNHDNKYYTPSFILPGDQEISQKNDDEFFEKHNQKVMEFSIDDNQNNKIFRPKPISHKCAVCKTKKYGDYLKHIRKSSHLSRVLSSPYNKFINELTQKYQPNNIKLNKQITKELKKMIPSPTIQQSETNSNQKYHQPFSTELNQMQQDELN